MNWLLGGRLTTVGDVTQAPCRGCGARSLRAFICEYCGRPRTDPEAMRNVAREAPSPLEWERMARAAGRR